MSSLSTLPKGDSAWLLRKSIQRIMQQVSVLETNIGSSTTGNSADTQVIFNDNGTLRGDTGLTFNKTTDLLTVGAATITGDLTVDTSTLKVDSANNRVGILTASPAQALDVASGNLQVRTGGIIYSDSFSNYGAALSINAAGSLPLRLQIGGTTAYEITSANVHTWQNVGGVAGTAMTLNATGLGVGTSPTGYGILALKKDNTSAPPYIVLDNRGTGGTDTNTYTQGGILFGAFRDVSNPAYIASITVERKSAAGGASSTGDLIFGTASTPTNGVATERLRIDASGNVGIGVAPSAWGIYKGLQVGYASLAGYAGSDTLLGSNVYFDGGAFKYIAAGLASSYRQLAGGHQWSTAVAGANPGDPLTLLPQMTLDTSGNLSIANGNVILGTSGKGIDFSATPSGSGTMTSELLNDYEEGTFTPTVRGSTTSGTGTYTTQFGRYTKVGRLVTVTVTLNWTAHTGTGNLQFAGLPFVSANTASAYDGIAIAYQSNISSAANTVLYGLVEFGSTVVTMTATPVGGGGYGLVAMDTAGEIAFTVTYTV